MNRLTHSLATLGLLSLLGGAATLLAIRSELSRASMASPQTSAEDGLSQGEPARDEESLDLLLARTPLRLLSALLPWKEARSDQASDFEALLAGDSAEASAPLHEAALDAAQAPAPLELQAEAQKDGRSFASLNAQSLISRQGPAGVFGQLGLASCLGLLFGLLVTPLFVLFSFLGRLGKKACGLLWVMLLALLFNSVGIVVGLVAWVVAARTGARWPRRLGTLQLGALAFCVGAACTFLFQREALPPRAMAELPDAAASRVIRHASGQPPEQRSREAWIAPSPSPFRPAKAVIVLLVDTLRADHVSIIRQGQEQERKREEQSVLARQIGAAIPASAKFAPNISTPGLDALFLQEGVVFGEAISAAPWTLPATVSLMTSLWPTQHRVEAGDRALDPGLATLAGAFSAQGFLSAAFTTHIYASSRFGLDSGFNEFHELSIDWGFGEGRQLRSGEVMELVEPWLEAHREEKFFLYLHLFDPHWDYDPPAPFDQKFTDPDYQGGLDGSWERLQGYQTPGRPMAAADLQQVVALYDGEIAYTDTQLMRLAQTLRRLDLYEDSAIFLVADHGEEFKEHQSLGHAKTLHRELLQIPLLLKPPGGRGQRGEIRPYVKEQVRSIDLAPTALELAGLSRPPSFEGRSLLPLCASEPPPEGRGDRLAFSHLARNAFQASSLRDGRYVLIHSKNPLFGEAGRLELFDLQEDPWEQRPLDLSRPEAQALLQRLSASMRAQALLPAASGATPSQADKVELTPEETQMLRSLGYVQ